MSLTPYKYDRVKNIDKKWRVRNNKICLFNGLAYNDLKINSYKHTCIQQNILSGCLNKKNAPNV